MDESKQIRVLHRETRKYITIPDVCGIKIRGTNRENVICFHMKNYSYRLQYINTYGKPHMEYISAKNVMEYFRSGYYSIRKIGTT